MTKMKFLPKKANLPAVGRSLFDSFGLETFFITDLDSAWKFYPTETKYSITTPQAVAQFLTSHIDVVVKIKSEYANKTFILKEGDLEIYLGIQKGLVHVINFCQNNLKTYLKNTTDSKVQELKIIISRITGEQETDL